jgi:hypothetical protein
MVLADSCVGLLQSACDAVAVPDLIDLGIELLWIPSGGDVLPSQVINFSGLARQPVAVSGIGIGPGVAGVAEA